MLQNMIQSLGNGGARAEVGGAGARTPRADAARGQEGSRQGSKLPVIRWGREAAPDHVVRVRGCPGRRVP